METRRVSRARPAGYGPVHAISAREGAASRAPATRARCGRGPGSRVRRLVAEVEAVGVDTGVFGDRVETRRMDEGQQQPSRVASRRPRRAWGGGSYGSPGVAVRAEVDLTVSRLKIGLGPEDGIMQACRMTSVRTNQNRPANRAFSVKPADDRADRESGISPTGCRGQGGFASTKKTCKCSAFCEAADGIRTHDLLHGKQSMGPSCARKMPANERLPTG